MKDAAPQLAGGTGLAETGDVDLVITSLGAAGIACVRALAKALPLAPDAIARALLTAPTRLLRGVEPDRAEAIAAELRQMGLEVALVGADEPVAGDERRLEVVLEVGGGRRMRDVLLQVTDLLGIDVAAAAALLRRDPAVLLAGVSPATVTALERRFAPLGATVTAYDPAVERFDCLVGDVPAGRQLAVQADLRRAGVDVAPPWSILPGLEPETAQAVADLLAGHGVGAQLVAQAAHRADVELVEHRAAERDALVGILAELGVPEAVHDRLLAQPRVVIGRRRPLAEALAVVERLTAIGARAEAHLCCTLRFDGRITEVGDGRRTAEVLAELTDLGPASRSAVCLGKQVELGLTLTQPHMDWLKHELAAVGTRLEVLKR